MKQILATGEKNLKALMNTDLARIAVIQKDKVVYLSEDGKFEEVENNVGVMCHAIKYIPL